MLKRKRDNSCSHFAVRRAVRINHFHADHQAKTAHITDHRVLCLQLFQFADEILAHAAAIFDRAALERVNRSKRSGTGNRVCAKRAAVRAEKNSQKKPVKNADLIRAIDAEISKRPGSVKFVWVKGHAGNAGNEKVDELARTYAGDCRSKVREGYLPLEGWQSLLASEYSQGIDVPDDAQMLLDGKITSDEYHIGRGQGESAGGSLADDLIGVSDPEPRPRSIADMLVEPEGYPTPDEATLLLPPNGMPAESDEMPEPTTVLATAVSDSTPSDTATSDSTQSDTTAPRKSYAEMLIKTDYFPREDAENTSDGTLQPTQSEQSATRSDETADSLQSPETQESLADAPQSAMQPQQSQQPRRKSPSGLSVSGTIRFMPPPNSSPTFDGRLRRIRGYIAVEGYVQGDGTLVLEDAPFAVKHN